VAGQVLRSGTATAANHGEARGAESRSDFVHKLRIVLKELNETAVWLQLIGETSLLSSDPITAIVAENRELCRIIGRRSGRHEGPTVHHCRDNQSMIANADCQLAKSPIETTDNPHSISAISHPDNGDWEDMRVMSVPRGVPGKTA
jgi:four helix bundle protein